MYPVEVEHALADAPGVVEVAVFGAPDERWGQRVCAAIVGDAAPESVLAHAASRLAHFEVPTRWWIRTEPLPTNAVGKVLKRQLRAEWPQAPQPTVPSIRGVQ